MEMLLLLALGVGALVFMLDSSDSDDEVVEDDNYIRGTEGDDYIEAGSGIDSVFGLEGDDTVIGHDDGIVISLDAGNDEGIGGTGADSIFGGLGADVLDGNGGDDVLTGEEGNDTLDGGAGEDELFGGEGNDSLIGGAGNDQISGEEGDDTASGGDGDDIIFGGDGDDSLSGDADDDIFVGRGGEDTLVGGDGADSLFGYFDGSYDAQYESADILDPDVLEGGAGNDELELGSGDNAYGGEGTDVFFTGTWVDSENAPVIHDFASDETLIVVVPEDAEDLPAITLETNPETGDTHVLADAQTVAVVTDVISRDQIGVFRSGSSLPIFENVTLGTEGDDYIEAGSGIDSVFGLEGDDTVIGHDDGIVISLDAGNDEGIGGTGADSIFGGLGADVLDGNGGDDVLTGEEGNDTLDGGAGEDELFGGEGNDSLIGGARSDQISGEEGDDTALGGEGGDIIFGGDGNDSLSGEAGDDALTGSAGADTLIGGDGADDLFGYYDGSDNTQYESADILDPDVLEGGAGNDELELGSGDSAYGGEGTDIFISGTWIDPENAPVIHDFSPDETLLVLVSQSAEALPVITLETDPTTGDTRVLADSRTVAIVTEAISRDQIGVFRSDRYT